MSEDARSFWDWAVQAYGGEGVSEACLGLQDDHGLSVPLLLWAAWCAHTGRHPDAETIEAAADMASNWEAAIIGPVRAVRRRLKQRLLDVDDVIREDIRADIKAVELKAEAGLMRALEALAPAPGAVPGRSLALMVAAVSHSARALPRPALQMLSDRLWAAR